MTKQISKIKLLVAMAGLSMSLAGCCHLFLLPNCPPQITSQPLTQIAKQGTSVTFSVAAKPAPVTYQWQFNGDDIRGATDASYTISKVAVRNVGEYRVLIQRIGKQQTTTTSKTAFLSIITPSTTSGLGNGGTLTAPIGSFGNYSGSICSLPLNKLLSYTPFDGPNVSSPSQNFPNPSNYSSLTISTTGNNPQLSTGVEILLNGSIPPHYWSDCGNNNATRLTVSPLQNAATYRVGIYFKSIPGATTVSWSWLYQ